MQQLENIRRQNYFERKALQNRNQHANKPPLPASKLQEQKPPVPAALDPRFDPEVRRQKIAALKVFGVVLYNASILRSTGASN